MKSAAIAHVFEIYAREFFTALVLAVLLSVTACAADDYTPRAELAPPPPFITANQSFGPSVPMQMAMQQDLQNIEPTAGDEYVPDSKCVVRSSFSPDESRMDFAFGGLGLHENDDLSFDHTYAGGDSAGMVVRFTVALPSAQKARCR